jgi:hypothetical protein
VICRTESGPSNYPRRSGKLSLPGGLEPVPPSLYGIRAGVLSKVTELEEGETIFTGAILVVVPS